MTHLINDIYAIEVPDPANAIISGNVITWKNAQAQGRGFMSLPAGNWQLICTTKEATPERHAELFGHAFIGDEYARQTLKAMLTSKGLDVNKNYVLIKKQ